MEVGLLSYGLDRAAGGIGRYTEELWRSLGGAGLRPTVFWAGRRRAENGIVPLPGAGRLPGLLTLGQAEIALLARKHKLDLVHDPTGSAPLGLVRTGRVTTIHDVVPYVYPETSSRLDRLIYRYWLPSSVQGMDAIITDSQCSKGDIVRFLKVPEEDVHVVPIASNRRYAPTNASATGAVLAKYEVESPYILYVGSIVPRKNLVRLLEAYSELLRWSGKWRLLIAGARKWRSSPVYETVERLSLADSVQFVGYVEEADLPALYSGADLFVFPSLYEGFGLPVLEAMACGTPVVTSNVSSLPEVAGDAAILVDPYRVGQIAEAMQRVLADGTLAGELRAKGMERAEQFSWERTARETIAVYEKVFSVQPSSAKE